MLTYLAVTCAGAVIVPFDILLKKDELAAVARASGARTIFTSAEYFSKVSSVCAEIGGTGSLVLFDDPVRQLPRPGSRRWPVASFGSLLEAGRAARAVRHGPLQGRRRQAG